MNRDLGDLLRQEADRHHPDTDRIRARLDAPALRPRPAPLGLAARGARPALGARRPGRLGVVLSAAAAALVLAGTSALAVRAGDRAGPPATPPLPTTSTSGTATPAPPTGVAVPDPAGTLSRPDRTAGRTPPGRSAEPRTPAAGTSAPPPGTGPVTVDLRLRQDPPETRAVTIGPGELDWLVPAGPAAGPGTGLSAPELTGAAAAPGSPYTLSWAGGRTTRWLAVEEGGRIRVRVPSAAGTRQLRLWVGTAGGNCEVELHVGPERRTVTLTTPAPAGVVTVTFSGPAELVVDLTGRFGLSALALRPAP